MKELANHDSMWYYLHIIQEVDEMSGVSLEIDANIRKQVEAILAEHGFVRNRNSAIHYVSEELAEAQAEIDSGTELDDAYLSLNKVACKYGI